jgi:hypothetical protein
MMDYICQPNLKPQTILSSQYKESAKIPQQWMASILQMWHSVVFYMGGIAILWAHIFTIGPHTPIPMQACGG